MQTLFPSIDLFLDSRQHFSDATPRRVPLSQRFVFLKKKNCLFLQYASGSRNKLLMRSMLRLNMHRKNGMQTSSKDTFARSFQPIPCYPIGKVLSKPLFVCILYTTIQ